MQRRDLYHGTLPHIKGNFVHRFTQAKVTCI